MILAAVQSSSQLNWPDAVVFLGGVLGIIGIVWVVLRR